MQASLANIATPLGATANLPNRTPGPEQYRPQGRGISGSGVGFKASDPDRPGSFVRPGFRAGVLNYYAQVRLLGLRRLLSQTIDEPLEGLFQAGDDLLLPCYPLFLRRRRRTCMSFHVSLGCSGVDVLCSGLLK